MLSATFLPRRPVVPHELHLMLIVMTEIICVEYNSQSNDSPGRKRTRNFNERYVWIVIVTFYPNYQKMDRWLHMVTQSNF